MNSLAIINRIYVREAYSLLQYAKDTSPWTGTPQQRQTLEQIRRLINKEHKTVNRLADFLIRRRTAPGIGHFPQEFTNMHYIGLDHLLPRLAAYQRWAVSELEADVARIDEPEARSLGQHILDLKRNHLAEMELMAGENSKVVSTLR